MTEMWLVEEKKNFDFGYYETWVFDSIWDDEADATERINEIVNSKHEWRDKDHWRIRKVKTNSGECKVD